MAESEERREQAGDATATPVMLGLLEPRGDASEEALGDASVWTPQDDDLFVRNGGAGYFFMLSLVLPVALGWIATAGASVSEDILVSGDAECPQAAGSQAAPGNVSKDGALPIVLTN